MGTHARRSGSSAAGAGPRAAWCRRRDSRSTCCPGRGLQRRLTLANIGVVVADVTAFVRALGFVRRYRPRVVVGFGGYASLPCIVAAWVWRVPRVVHEQDAVIGLANRIGVRLGARVASVVARGRRCRTRCSPATRCEPSSVTSSARRRSRRCVAAFGGALGAGRSTAATLGLYDRWRDRTDVAVHHVSGPRNEQRVREPRSRRSSARATRWLTSSSATKPHMPALLSTCNRCGVSSRGRHRRRAHRGRPSRGARAARRARRAIIRRATRATLAEAGAAVVVPDAECDAARLDAVVAGAARRTRPGSTDGGGRARAQPARRRGPSRRSRRGARP